MLYFDHAATTPMRESAKHAWLQASSALNPSGQYALGRRARSLLDDARETVAKVFSCDPIEVIFTASGTESDNIALKGLHAISPHSKVVISAIEHSAVYETAQFLGDVELLPVTREGFVHDPHGILAQPAAVVSCMWANNETGAIQPVGQIIAATSAPVHVDAVQAVGKVPINFHALGAASLAMSGHKFGGPRGVGVLLAKRSPAPAPLFHGGGQERGIRSGTVDVAGACGFAAALTEAVATMDQEQQRLAALKDMIIAGLPEDSILNTPKDSLATHVNVSFPGAEGDSLIMLLDSQGFALATGSACANGVNRASRVLLAQGVDEKTARGTLRISLGYTTTEDEVAQLIEALPKAVAIARQAGMA